MPLKTYAVQPAAPRRRRPTRPARTRGHVDALNQHALRTAVRAALPGADRPTEVEALEGRTLMSVSTDANGWTIVTPATGTNATRIVYVSSSTGDDGRTGLSEDQAVRTIGKGRSLIRDGSADWLLLKRGDVFTESMTQWNKTGRSAQEPILISSYGNATTRPLIKTGTSNGFTTGNAPVSNVYVIGLHFTANIRNPDFAGTDFDAARVGEGASYGVQMLSQSSNVLFEDNVFDAYKNNVAIQGGVNGRVVTNVALRRNQILDSFNTGGNSQGLYVERVDGLTVYQNLFDHNGWDTRVQAWATQLNHNVYLHSSNTGVVFEQNISANASSHGLQMRPGGIARDNLFLGNPIGMSFGLTNGATVKAGGVEGEVTGNVFLDSRSIGTNGRGWGIEIANTKPGANVTVRDNIFAHDSQKLFPAIMLNFGFGGDNATNSAGLNDLTLQGNIVYKWYQGLSTSADFVPGGTGQVSLNNLTVRGNDFETLADSRIILQNHAYSAAEEHWSENTYWDDSPASGWFSMRGTLRSFDYWRQNVEPTAVQQKQDYQDPERSAGSYNATLGGAATTAAFVTEARGQSKANYRPQYGAAAVINYVRQGFVVDTGDPVAVVQPQDVTSTGGSTYTFTVTYSDAGGINASTIDSNDVRVTGPAGYDRVATLVGVASAPAGGRVATYSIPAPGGSWSLSDDGVYAIAMRANQVADASGKFVPAGQIGSFRARTDAMAPNATATAPNVEQPGATEQKITVVYNDNGRLDVSTLDGDDVRVQGPDGFDVAARFVSVNDATDGSPRTALYVIDARGGTWDPSDSGTYTITANANEVADTSGNFLPGGEIGRFNVGLVLGGNTNTAPVAVLSAPNVVAASSSRHAFTVTYTDADGVDLSSIDANDLRVTSSRGENKRAAVLDVAAAADGKQVVVTYGSHGPGGSWDVTDNGTHTVTLAAGQVRDLRGMALASSRALGTFQAAIPTAPGEEEPNPQPSNEPPRVTYAALVPGSDDQLVFRFSSNVSASLSIRDFVICRTKEGCEPLDADDMRLTWNAARNEAVITFPGLNKDQLQRAHWKATIKSSGVTSAAGVRLDGNANGTPGGDFIYKFKRS